MYSKAVLAPRTPAYRHVRHPATLFSLTIERRYLVIEQWFMAIERASSIPTVQTLGASTLDENRVCEMERKILNVFRGHAGVQHVER